MGIVAGLARSAVTGQGVADLMINPPDDQSIDQSMTGSTGDRLMVDQPDLPRGSTGATGSRYA
jgi:hypothetical protein